MPRYFFDVTDGHRLFDASGFVCEDDPERRIAIVNDAGREIGNMPVYSRPSYENPAK